MQIDGNVHAFLNLVSAFAKVQVQVTAQLGEVPKAEIQNLKARELKAILVVSRLSLMRKRELTLKELAEHLNSPPSTVSLLVSSLVKKKFLCRTTGTVSRRCVQISLSDKGKSMIETMYPELERCIDGLMERLTPAERASFLSISQKFYGLSYPSSVED